MRWSCTKLLKPNFLMGLKSLSNWSRFQPKQIY
jgi:hypothetical protein